MQSYFSDRVFFKALMLLRFKLQNLITYQKSKSWNKPVIFSSVETKEQTKPVKQTNINTPTISQRRQSFVMSEARLLVSKFLFLRTKMFSEQNFS